MWPEKEALKFQAVWLEYLTLLHSEWPKLCGVLTILSAIGLKVKESFCFKGRFLLFQVCHNFANLFFKLSVSTFYKEKK